MRITDTQKIANRHRIVDVAARLFRERGVDGVGVADIMKAAGFTHGGFYNHFASKDELVVEAVRRGFEVIEQETRGGSLTTILERYLSQEHRDDLGSSCPAAALGSDAARQPETTKAAFADGIENWISLIREGMAIDTENLDVSDRQTAINHLARVVGAVILSRSCPGDSNLRDEILKACALPPIQSNLLQSSHLQSS